MRIPWLSVLVLALVPIGFSCKTTLTDFTCSVDADCTSTGTPGFCEASGSCSYADVDCPDGRRYGSASGELSNQCVSMTLDGGLDGLDGGRSTGLSGLVLASSSALVPPFSPSHFSYTLDVSLLESELRITPSAVNPDAEIQVDELAVASGSVSGPIALDLGATLIHVDVMTSFGTQRYSVSVERGSKMIGQIAYGKASNAGNKDQFGRTLAISGDTLVVGAAGEDSSATGVDGDQNNDDAEFSGAVYVFRRTGASWTQEAYLKASNSEERDLFGHSVAIEGDTLAVGAFEEESTARGVNGDQSDNEAPDSGAVYVFTRSGSTWTQEAYLKASNTGSNDKFGASVALSGDTLVVSAEGEASSATGVNGDQTDNMMFGSGAAYVFRRIAGGWAQEAYVKASNPASFDRFGISIDINGDIMAVGAHTEDSSATGVNGIQNDDSADGSGAVYVFGRSGTTWVQEAYLKASNTSSRSFFGASLDLNETRLVVGARNEGSLAEGSGAAYVFHRENATWAQEAYLKASNAREGDQFGFSVAIQGDIVAVGTTSEDSSAVGVNGDQFSTGELHSGAAYVFRRGGMSWVQEAYVKASNTDSNDSFGYQVAISNDSLVITAPFEDSDATGVGGSQVNGDLENPGAFYLFQ